MPIDFRTMQRINREVTLRVEPARPDTPEEAEFRKELENDVKKIRDQALTPEPIWESHDPD